MSMSKRHSIKIFFTLMLALGISLSMSACSSSFSKAKLKELYAHPDEFKGKTIKELTMQIVAVDKVHGEIHLQGYEDFAKQEHPTVVVVSDNKVKYEDGEYIKVKGKVLGKAQVVDEESTEMTAVKLEAKKIQKIKSTDAIPAEETLDIGYDVKVKGVSATVQKVDLTSDETRVYIKVKNDTKKNIEIYPDQSILSQDGNDYESDLDNYLYDDVHMQKNIKAGSSISGVIIFKRIDSNLPFTFTLEGADNEGNEIELPFSFEMK